MCITSWYLSLLHFLDLNSLYDQMFLKQGVKQQTNKLTKHFLSISWMIDWLDRVLRRIGNISGMERRNIEWGFALNDATY